MRDCCRFVSPDPRSSKAEQVFPIGIEHSSKWKAHRWPDCCPLLSVSSLRHAVSVVTGSGSLASLAVLQTTASLQLLVFRATLARTLTETHKCPRKAAHTLVSPGASIPDGPVTPWPWSDSHTQHSYSVHAHACRIESITWEKLTHHPCSHTLGLYYPFFPVLPQMFFLNPPSSLHFFTSGPSQSQGLHIPAVALQTPHSKFCSPQILLPSIPPPPQGRGRQPPRLSSAPESLFHLLHRISPTP